MHSVALQGKLTTVIAAALLTAFTVHHQMTFMGLDWYETVQWERTQRVIHGESGTPWQYRLLTEGSVYALVRAAEALDIPRPVATVFIAVRLAQNLAAFLLLTALYRRLGIAWPAAIFGVSMLALGMGHALYDGDLTFNTYTDISLFALAALIILSGRVRWLLLLMPFAALNRETSGCIPFMLLFATAQVARASSENHASTLQFQWERGSLSARLRIAGIEFHLRHLEIFIAALATWLAIVGGLRLVYGLRPYIVPTAGASPIWPLLSFNLTFWRTWVFLFATLGLAPLLGLSVWRAWPVPLRRFFWAIVPIWFPAHFMLAHAPETRLFLVPQAIIFLPGALVGISLWAARSTAAAPPPRESAPS